MTEDENREESDRRGHAVVALTVCVPMLIGCCIATVLVLTANDAERSLTKTLFVVGTTLVQAGFCVEAIRVLRGR